MEKTLFKKKNQWSYLHGNNLKHWKVCDKCKKKKNLYLSSWVCKNAQNLKKFPTQMDSFRCIVRILLAIVSRCTMITAPSSWFFLILFFLPPPTSHLPHARPQPHISRSNSPFHPLKMCGLTCVGRLDSDLFAFQRLCPIHNEVFHYFYFHYFWLLGWK